MTEVKERGHASIFIEIKNGVITVTHGTDKVTLAEWVAQGNDWDQLWQTINRLKTHAEFNEGVKPEDIKLPNRYECPHLGCDDISGKTRAELKSHLQYWHRSTNKEIDEILSKQ